ncbi:MAG TPA: PIG-L family deacetylase [Thermoanaerobaculia bacterium]|nr:PIG-L family deacetylase [Thermoanaerobaculia bacterium]
MTTHLRVAGSASVVLVGSRLATGCAGGADRLALPATDVTAATPSCDNEELTAFSELLVIAPHPDDEVLGFAGLIDAYVAQGKPVGIVVTTDGDAYCEACRFWKSGSMRGPTCSAEELSSFATPGIDSFAEVRRGESRAGLEILAAPAPIFLGYPDTGLAAAWRNHQAARHDQPLRRSDFSGCADCETCPGGYGEGPVTELSAATLVDSLTELLGGTDDDALVATTHWLDGHGDHAGLGRLVEAVNDGLERKRAIAFGVIHAHTPKEMAHPDCWYPQPAAPVCPCADQDRAAADPDWLASLRSHRLRPDLPARLPDDADYGDESQLCLDERLYDGAGAKKLAAVRAYRSQLGFLAREGELRPGVGGLMDCSGYLISFVRRTEAFVLRRAN